MMIVSSFQLKEGVFDVIPAGCVDSLTAEDFRLLLNGVGDINVTTLISYTSFNDESGEQRTEKSIKSVEVNILDSQESQVRGL